MPGRIAIVLPPREGFADAACGAVGLCVRDFTLASRFRDRIEVLGTSKCGFDGLAYRPVDVDGWFGSRGRRYARRLGKIFVETPPRWVEVQNRPLLASMLAGKAKVALHLHNDPQEMAGARTVAERRKLAARIGLIVCVSDYIRQRFAEGIDAPHVVVVPNGLGLPENVPAKMKEIVFCGRLAETKGAREFALAMEKALPSCPGWKAVIIGADRHDGAGRTTGYEQETRAILLRLAEAGRAEMTGYLPHEAAMARLARAAIAVVPSVWLEPFGRSALEAMAYGAALVSSGRGGLSEVTGDAALTVPPEPAALANAVVALCADDARREALAERGRERARTFEISAMASRLDAARERFLA